MDDSKYKYTYFIVFVHSQGWGNDQVHLGKPVTSLNFVRHIEGLLSKHYENPTLMGWPHLIKEGKYGLHQEDDIQSSDGEGFGDIDEEKD